MGVSTLCEAKTTGSTTTSSTTSSTEGRRGRPGHSWRGYIFLVIPPLQLFSNYIMYRLKSQCWWWIVILWSIDDVTCMCQWLVFTYIDRYILCTCVGIHINIYTSTDLQRYSYIIEGSLEVKLPTIWRDEKQSRAEAERRERLEERRSEEKE